MLTPVQLDVRFVDTTDTKMWLVLMVRMNAKLQGNIILKNYNNICPNKRTVVQQNTGTMVCDIVSELYT